MISTKSMTSQTMEKRQFSQQNYSLNYRMDSIQIYEQNETKQQLQKQLQKKNKNWFLSKLIITVH